MRVCCLSDLHLVGSRPQCRIDDIVDYQWEKLKHVFKVASRKGCGVVAQAGDLTDAARSWYVLPRFLSLLSYRWGFKFYGVYGQHDTYMYSENTRDRTNLGVVASGKRARILTARPVVRGGVRFYGASWGQPIPTPKNRRKKNVLVAHASVGPVLYPGHSTTSARRFLRKHKRFDLIIVGDVHRAFIEEDEGRYIVNTGPMVRKWADDYILGHEPHFYIWESTTGRIRRHDIPHTPAADAITRAHLDSEEQADYSELVDEFVDAMIEEDSHSIDIRAIIEDVIRRQGTTNGAVNIIEHYMENAHADT